LQDSVTTYLGAGLPHIRVVLTTLGSILSAAMKRGLKAAIYCITIPQERIAKPLRRPLRRGCTDAL